MPSESLKSCSAFIESVLAVIVTYGRAFDRTPAYRTLYAIAQNVKRKISICVYDNSPSSMQSLPETGEFLSVTYVAQPDNPGLSASYNKAAKTALDSGKFWLLFLDQDACFPPDSLRHYFEAQTRMPGIGLFCPVLTIRSNTIISPFQWILDRPHRFTSITPGTISSRFSMAVNNGMLVSIEAFGKTGGYDETIKIDFSDIAFFRKFKKRYRRFGIVDVRAEHTLDSVVETDSSRAAARFSLFCADARRYCRQYSRSKGIVLFSLARAIKLALQWKDPRFISSWVRLFLFGKDLRTA